MIEVSIPGYRTLQLEYLVLDHNGTLAVDGVLKAGVSACLKQLSEHLKIYVVTADTFGKAASRLEDYPCQLVVLPVENQAEAKLEYIERLGAERDAQQRAVALLFFVRFAKQGLGY